MKDLVRMTRRGRVAALAVAGLAAACAPNLGKLPHLATPSDFATRRSFAVPETHWPAQNWWLQFHDSELTALITEGLKGAPDLRIAEARLRQAAGVAEEAGATELPSLNGTASVMSTKPNVNNGFPPFIKPYLPHGWHTEISTALDFNYDFDFWGKNRATLAAATSQEQAAAADVAEARLSLSTAIASTYAKLVALETDLRTLKQAVRVREQSAQLVQSRVQHGLENQGPLAQARAEVAIAKGQLAQIAGEIARTRHQIAALLGKGPDAGLAISPQETVQPLAYGLPPALPADLVGRRPDIVAARLEAEVAAQRIKVARAGFYPDINLSAQIGNESLDPRDFFNKGSIMGAVGPAVHLPIFEGGQLEGAYRGARARYEEAVATYDKTLAHAFAQVADALSDAKTLSAEISDAHMALVESERAYQVAKIRYRGGLSRYLNVLTAENTVLQQQQSLADLKSDAFLQNIALIRALGGGFDVRGTALASNTKR
ncbi:MAG: efflux transporter outer membrane subunit [Alphaproteobacteria bacterium]|nr:efflux transporter outer membrane subunit [Alphaproteobacteria bacterium]